MIEAFIALANAIIVRRPIREGLTTHRQDTGPNTGHDLLAQSLRSAARKVE
ncbi:hypothetical protein [Arthrobacter sp. A5]|uniref:hypothetical protein n=1 Tax=Arthrobacter sp. A5 TaxID=576926 RepID=UPI003DAA24B2